MKPLLPFAVHQACRRDPPAQLIAPGLWPGDVVTVSHPSMPGAWAYTGDGFVRPDQFKQAAPPIDYGVRPRRRP